MTTVRGGSEREAFTDDRRRSEEVANDGTLESALPSDLLPRSGETPARATLATGTCCWVSSAPGAQALPLIAWRQPRLGLPSRAARLRAPLAGLFTTGS